MRRRIHKWSRDWWAPSGQCSHKTNSLSSISEVFYLADSAAPSSTQMACLMSFFLPFPNSPSGYIKPFRVCFIDLTYLQLKAIRIFTSTLDQMMCVMGNMSLAVMNLKWVMDTSACINGKSSVQLCFNPQVNLGFYYTRPIAEGCGLPGGLKLWVLFGLC